MEEIYNKLYSDSIEKIKSDNYEIDPMIDSSSDKRFGITLLIRPSKQIKNNINEFLKELKLIDTEQYYYPISDMHLTVLSIISCHEGFNLNKFKKEEYIKLIKGVVEKYKEINIKFKGLTVSPSCIMIQGFPNDDLLNDVRNKIRYEFSQSSLQQSIDQRYRLQTAHLTVVRFRRRIKRKDEYLNKIEKYKNYEFGTFTPDAMELVFNDWYHKRKYEKTLHQFILKK